MNVIFLDIDGVLNSTRSGMAFGGKSFFPDLTDPKNFPIMDSVAVLLLKHLVTEFDLKIVISSTWRKHNPLHAFHYYFSKEYGWDTTKVIIDCTPVINELNSIRGDEIQAWLDEHVEVDTFFILDDDSDMGHLLPHLVKTDNEIGLTHHHTLRIAQFYDFKNAEARLIAQVNGRN